MKKKYIPLICLFFIFINLPHAAAQGNIRVKCNQFTMNVPSSNVRCYQVDQNIILDEGASPDEIENAQVANTSIYFTDYEYTRSKISPQVIFYLIDDLSKSSLDLFDRTLDLSDIINNIKSEFSTAEENRDNIPFLPYQAKSPTLKALPVKLDFTNGTGVRYIISFEETLSGNTDTNLYYTWQGLSDDGLYYISAVFPIRSVRLNGQPVSSLNPDQIDASDFEPSLKELDYYVQSIVIE